MQIKIQTKKKALHSMSSLGDVGLAFIWVRLNLDMLLRLNLHVGSRRGERQQEWHDAQDRSMSNISPQSY